MDFHCISCVDITSVFKAIFAVGCVARRANSIEPLASQHPMAFIRVLVYVSMIPLTEPPNRDGYHIWCPHPESTWKAICMSWWLHSWPGVPAETSVDAALANGKCQIQGSYWVAILFKCNGRMIFLYAPHPVSDPTTTSFLSSLKTSSKPFASHLF